MPDPLEELAAVEAGTSPQEPEAPAEPQGEPELHPVLQERFGGDVNKLADSYAELDRFLGQQGNQMGKEIAELKAQLAAQSPQPQQQQEQGMPDLDMGTLQQWYDENPVEATAWIVAKAQEPLLAQMQQQLDARFTPIEKTVGQSTASTLADGLRKNLGNDVVDANMGQLQAALKADPALTQGEPQVVYQRMKRILTDADWERTRASANGQTQHAAPAAVRVEGGSTGRSLAPAGEDELTPEQELHRAMTQTPVVRDIFGNDQRRA